MRHIFLSRDCKGWHNVFDGVGIEPTLHLPKKCVLSTYTNYRSNHPFRYAILDFKELKSEDNYERCCYLLSVNLDSILKY
jgi:hypothetical protein